MEKKITVQKIKKQFERNVDVAIKYYSILSILNDLELAPREIQLLAFTAVKGNISSGGAKKQFIDMFKTSKATIGNLIHTLTSKEKRYLLKDNQKVYLNPALMLDFNNHLILKIELDVKGE